MEIENLINSEIMQIIPMEAVENIMSILMGSTAEESSAEAVMEEPLVSMPLPEEKPAVAAAPEWKQQYHRHLQEPIYNRLLPKSPGNKYPTAICRSAGSICSLCRKQYDP